MNKRHEGFSIYHDLVIGAPPAKVFQAVSQPHRLINWWPQKCSGIPALGEEYNFFFTSEYDWYGKVSKIIPNKAFFIKMTRSDEDWDLTTFGFEIEEKPDGSLVKFSHKGWPYCNSHFRFSSYCWALLLKGLKDYVESGIIIPFENRS